MNGWLLVGAIAVLWAVGIFLMAFSLWRDVEGWLDGEPIAEENLWIAQEICEQFVAEGSEDDGR